jgi:hypothetical protein
MPWSTFSPSKNHKGGYWLTEAELLVVPTSRNSAGKQDRTIQKIDVKIADYVFAYVFSFCLYFPYLPTFF